jgi:hypothetical protein
LAGIKQSPQRTSFAIALSPSLALLLAILLSFFFSFSDTLNRNRYQVSSGQLVKALFNAGQGIAPTITRAIPPKAGRDQVKGNGYACPKEQANRKAQAVIVAGSH